MTRECGDCQLCCRLLAVPPLGKKAGENCRFQKFHKGCTVYHTARMPPDCALWNCRWLVNNDTADLSRPDRSHYVIDIMPDFVTVQNNESGEQQHIQVVQVWVDPRHRDAHKDQALRAYILRRAHEGIATIIRFSAYEAFTIFARDGEWHEVRGRSAGYTHTFDEVVQALGAKQTEQTIG